MNKKDLENKNNIEKKQVDKKSKFSHILDISDMMVCSADEAIISIDRYIGLKLIFYDTLYSTIKTKNNEKRSVFVDKCKIEVRIAWEKLMDIMEILCTDSNKENMDLENDTYNLNGKTMNPSNTVNR